METYKDIKDFVFAALQDTEAGQFFFTSTQIQTWTNLALWEMAEHAQYLDKIETQNTADGTAAYYVGGNGTPPFGIWRMEIDDEAIQAISQDRLREFSRTWKDVSGQPHYYYLDDINYTPDYYQFRLWEEPNGVYEIRSYVYDLPAQVFDGAETDSLQVPQWAVYGVAWYVLSEAYMAETTRQSYDTAAFYRMLYDDILDRLSGRAADKLGEKQWIYGGGSSRFLPDFWDNLPDTIPEP